MFGGGQLGSTLGGWFRVCALSFIMVACGGGQVQDSIAQSKTSEVQKPKVSTKVKPQMTRSAVGKKVAVLVGIDNYRQQVARPNVVPWADLKGTHRDLRAIETQLKRRGFQVVMLLDGAATRDGILKTVETYLLNTEAPLEAAYFHFSGHGQQIEDDNNEEADGCDESLVPYDHLGVKNGRNNLRDDDLGALFEKISKRSPNFLVTIDSCHSGSATRGSSSSAGHYVKRGAPGTCGCTSGNCGRPNGGGFFGKRLNYTVLSATLPHQLANEVTFPQGRMGAFTKEWVELLATNPTNMSYRKAQRLLAGRMEKYHHQQPAAEGTVRRGLFSGQEVDDDAVLVRVVDGVYRIDASVLTNYVEGALVGVYPNGMKRGTWADAPIVLKVSQVTLTETAAVLESSKSDEALKRLNTHGGSARLLRASPNKGFVIALDKTNLTEAMLNEVKYLTWVKVVSKQGAAYRVQPSKGGFELLDNDGKRLGIPFECKKMFNSTDCNSGKAMGKTFSDSESHRLGFALTRAYHEIRIAKAMELGEEGGVPSSQFAVEVVLENGGAEPKRLDNGLVVPQPEAQKFRIKVKNNSDKPVFPHALWFDADGAVTPIVPWVDKNKGVCEEEKEVIPPGGEVVFPLCDQENPYTFGPALGEHQLVFLGTGTSLKELDTFRFVPKRQGGKRSAGRGAASRLNFGVTSVRVITEAK